MDTTTTDTPASATITLTLPKTLLAAYDALARREGRPAGELMRAALEAYAAHSVAVPEANGDHEPTPAIAVLSATVDVDEAREERRRRHLESLGIDPSTVPTWSGIAEAPDDGYDSTNIKDWIRKTWKPD